jgi:FAD/FMN-containing dehydrogenase
MSDKVLAKVDYLKPLEGRPYHEVTAEKESYHREVKNRLAGIVGGEQVTDAPEVIARYSQDRSLERAGRPSFVVFPGNAADVCAMIKYANEISLPVVPVSSGTHTYGSAIPRMGGIVIDLSGWKKIHTIDRRNRSVRIEPGVTYHELQVALEKEGLRALIPLLPRKDQSVLTAHLEAHPMMISEFNYSEPLRTAEIVLPNGEILRTGSAAPAPPEVINTNMVGPWGPGFDWNRLYTRAQGTLGIVTWANIMAEPLPTKEKIYFTPFQSIDDLVSFTYRIQRKWIGYECLALNRASLAAILAERMPDDYHDLKKKLPEYTHIFCIAGLKRFPEERIAYQEADFLEVARECSAQPQLTIPEAPAADPFFGQHVRRCWAKEPYWKEAYKGASADIFFIMTMNRASAFITAMQEETARAEYPFEDIGIYLQPIENGRAAHLEFIIPYNPDDTGECSLVRRLHRSVSERMYALGALFTRAYGTWAEMVYGRNALQYQTAKLIKETLDPNNIMNPGKLGL